MIKMNIYFHKISRFLLCNFLLIYALNRVFSFVGIDLHAIQVFHLLLGIFGIQFLLGKKLHPFNMLVLVYMLYLILNGVFIEYKDHWSYMYRTLPVAMASIFFYFIGRYSTIPTMNILQKMKWPWVVLSIIGIYCFFVLPNWYTQMKIAQIKDDNVEDHVMGIYRLSSIWGHPYQITYATFLYGVNLITLLASNLDKRKSIWALMLLCVIVLLLGQIRVTILGFLLSILVFFIFKKKDDRLKWSIYMILLFLIINCVLTIISTFDVGSYRYIIEHMFSLTEKNALTERLEYTSGGITHYTLFGDGYGRYGYEAREHDRFAIVDSEYQKHLAEVGYLGTFLLFALLIFTFIKAVKERNFPVEFSIWLFYCFAMIGASVLSNPHQYGFMFWFCMGRIWASKKPQFGTVS